MFFQKIKNYKKKVAPLGSFASHVMTLMTGTTIAQALAIVASPILTRIYSPAAFGVFALYSSIISILSIVICWRYELTIVLPEKDTDAINLFALSNIICFSMVLLILILLIFFHTWITHLIGNSELIPWLWLLPVNLIAVGVFLSLNYWITRRKEFKRLAIRQIIQNTLTPLTQIVSSVIFQFGAGGMIVGSILGQVLATTGLARYIWKNDRGILSSVSVKGMKEQAIVYKDFPRYQIWAALLNMVSSLIPVLLLGYFFSLEIVGFYALGQKVVTSPLSIIVGSVSQVFFPQAELARRNKNLHILVSYTYKKLLTIGLFPICVLAITGPELIKFIFGAKWVLAGIFLRWLCPFLLVQFLSQPISGVFSVLGKQKEYLFFNIMYFIFSLLSLTLGGLRKNSQLAITLYSLTTFILYCYFIMKIFRLSGINFHEILEECSRLIMSTFIFLIPLIVVKSFNLQAKLIILLSIISTISFYFYILNKKEKIITLNISNT